MNYKREIRQHPGSGANHLRWLMYFDKEFLCFNNSDKLKFIEFYIYNKNRTWNNWIAIESNFRFQPELQSVIDINSNLAIESADTLFLYMTFQDYKLPFEHYFRLDLGAKGLVPSKFEQDCQKYNDVEIKNLPQSPNIKVLDCDVMFDRNLNKSFYQEVCEFFKFDDHFDQAQQVHELWYLARRKSAEDFCKYFLGDEFRNYIQTMQEKYKL